MNHRAKTPVAYLRHTQFRLLKDFVHRSLLSFFPAIIVSLIHGIFFLWKPWFACIFRWSYLWQQVICDNKCIGHSWNIFLANLLSKTSSTGLAAVLILEDNWSNIHFLHVESTFGIICQLDKKGEISALINRLEAPQPEGHSSGQSFIQPSPRLVTSAAPPWNILLLQLYVQD